MKAALRKFLNTSELGALNEVIAIDHEHEVAPEEAGISPAEAEEIWQSVIDLYLTGTQPAITFCMRRQGKIVFNRSIGHQTGNGPKDKPATQKILANPDMPVCLFSASKAITALLMHMLVEDGLVNLLDPVSYYLPEFAAKGKRNITIHQILSHRGGIPRLAADTPVETLWDEDRVWQLLCDAKPLSSSGNELSYHALTGGFVMGRVLEKVAGINIQQYLDKKIRDPMDMTYFTYGTPAANRHKLATNYATGPRPTFPVTIVVKRALGADIGTVEQVVNSPEWYSSIMPAGNLVGTSEEISRFYQMMLNGGEWQGKRICKEDTIRRAVQEYGTLQFDRTLMIPMRYSAGLMLGGNPIGMWGKNSRHAFGHIGLLNKLCWADEARDISVSLLTSGIPIIAHHIPALFGFVNSITRNCRRNREVRLTQ
ncbi:MAG: beta-lactamase family protein [Pseudomonadales bacterium]|uniref:Beta-lactamase class C and other penicillin binding protein n=1 Tax=Oleiphilus messinensis TaxID=141451 RepID=A0A1Y0IBR6_9GAMM|nr:serine hydrolase domain-containing protein [Oleiphilus messinensis]ARU57921.1 beta-lactamase class C and other penicillin binding protein [Oleiphilus messinensis]MCG8610115.1 beta-lactamase family protein [Pseudomonadales bacterium]